MKVMMLGDTHGDLNWVNKVIDFAVKQHADCIFQLGDFGIWGGDKGRRFVERISKHATQNEMPFYFLDGNHENFDKLDKWTDGIEPNRDGHIEMLENLFYSPRGNYWKWQNTRFMTMGGAVSVDKEWRLSREHAYNAPRTLWWPEEEITREDVDNVPDVSVDVLLSHDSVINPLPRRGTMAEYKMDAMSRLNRDRLKEVFFKVRPKLMFHGHFHYFHVSDYHGCKVIGLNMNGYNDSYCFYDTENGNYTRV